MNRLSSGGDSLSEYKLVNNTNCHDVHNNSNASGGGGVGAGYHANTSSCSDYGTTEDTKLGLTTASSNTTTTTASTVAAVAAAVVAGASPPTPLHNNNNQYYQHSNSSPEQEFYAQQQVPAEQKYRPPSLHRAMSNPATNFTPNSTPSPEHFSYESPYQTVPQTPTPLPAHDHSWHRPQVNTYTAPSLRPLVSCSDSSVSLFAGT